MLQPGQWLTFIVPFFFHYLFILFDRLYYSTRFGEILNPSYSQEEVPWPARTNTSHIATHAFEIVSLTPTLPFYDVFNSCVLMLRYLDLYHFCVSIQLAAVLLAFFGSRLLEESRDCHIKSYQECWQLKSNLKAY